MNDLSSVFITLASWLTTGITLITLLLPPSAPDLSLSGRQAVSLQQEKEAIFVATNQQRVRRHLSALTQDPKLMQAAQDYADLMAAKDQMSHTLRGLSLVDKARRVGYSFRQLSENIALNTYLDGRSVVNDQWMESTGHRKNLLTNDVTNIGIGIAGPSKQKRYYYCQLFGTPF